MIKATLTNQESKKLDTVIEKAIDSGFYNVGNKYAVVNRMNNNKRISILFNTIIEAETFLSIAINPKAQWAYKIKAFKGVKIA